MSLGPPRTASDRLGGGGHDRRTSCRYRPNASIPLVTRITPPRVAMCLQRSSYLQTGADYVPKGWGSETMRPFFSMTLALSVQSSRDLICKNVSG